MKEMIDRSTAENLKTTISQKLTDFGIPLTNIYSFSIDNGANVVKTVKLMRFESNINDESEDYISDDDSDDGGDEGDTSECDSDDDEEDENDSSFLEAEAWIDSVENAIITTFGESENRDSFNITVRCASHSIQLSVTDTIKTTRIKNLLKNCRKVVKKLRTPAMRLLIQKENGKKPIIESPIRWNSQFNMLFRLRELRWFCVKYENVTTELRLSEATWDNIDKLLDALKPLKILTRQVQSVQMTLSDFYGHYVKCRLLLSKNLENEYAQLFSKSMKLREAFFTNNILLAAVYLDPRYQVLLSKEDKRSAQKHLSLLYKKIHPTEDPGDSGGNLIQKQRDVAIADHEMEFETFLSQMDQQSITGPRSNSVTGASLLPHRNA